MRGSVEVLIVSVLDLLAVRVISAIGPNIVVIEVLREKLLMLGEAPVFGGEVCSRGGSCLSEKRQAGSHSGEAKQASDLHGAFTHMLA